MSMSSALERPVRGSVTPVNEVDWTIHVLNSRSPSDLLQRLADHGGSSTKMWSGCCLPTRDKTSKHFSNISKTAGTHAHGAFSILSTSEHARSHTLSHRDDVVCSLSDILETSVVPQQYYLTPKACAGILHRFERAGKVGKLPKRFREILEREAMEFILS